MTTIESTEKKVYRETATYAISAQVHAEIKEARLHPERMNLSRQREIADDVFEEVYLHSPVVSADSRLKLAYEERPCSRFFLFLGWYPARVFSALLTSRGPYYRILCVDPVTKDPPFLLSVPQSDLKEIDEWNNSEKELFAGLEDPHLFLLPLGFTEIGKLYKHQLEHIPVYEDKIGGEKEGGKEGEKKE